MSYFPAVITALALLALGGCTRPAAPPQASAALVLIVIDTLRADHLPCYGYDRPTAPAICALAADGILFERAYTTRTATTPAIASMLTGLYPHQHGLRALFWLLPEGVPTLAERLATRGYRTGAFVSSFVMVHDFSGFGRGFEIYDDDVRTREAFRDSYERAGTETVDAAAAWLATSGPGAFLFVHLIEPHGPYTPPSPYLERFALPPDGTPVPDSIPPYQRNPALHSVSEYVSRYDGEIAVVDDAVARLLATLRARGWYEDATIVLVADHGESLGEEGLWFQHGHTVGDPEAHVPLVVKPARSRTPAVAPGTRVAAPVSVADVYATLFAAAGGAPAAAAGGPVDLQALATGALARSLPPVTELADPDPAGVIQHVDVSVHGARCTERWRLPVAAGIEPAKWSAATAGDGAPAGDTACRTNLAQAADPFVRDLLTSTPPLAVVRNFERTPANRRQFIANRVRRGTPLAEHEHEALRQLGYAE